MPVKATIDIPRGTGRDGAMDLIANLQNEGSSPASCRLLHAGKSGSWYLAKDRSGVYVAHIPDLSTGSEVRRLALEDILVAGGPERDELVRLIGTLVESVDPT